MAIPTRVVRSAAAVAGPNESPNVISGNQQLRKPAPSARTEKSIASAAGSAVRKSPMPLSFARARYMRSIIAWPNAERETSCAPSISRAKS